MASTRITEKLIINAPDSDIVLDGLDFTDNGIIEVRAAKSLTLENCRVYNLKTPNAKNFFLHIFNDITLKIAIHHCFFGNSTYTKSNSIYNLFEPTAKLITGSMCSSNYFKADCCTHNVLSIYGADENAVIYVKNNIFEISDGTVRIGVKGEPVCIINIEGNTIKENKGDDPSAYGLVTLQPYKKETTSFANMTINMNNNIIPSEQKIYAYCGANDTQLTQELMPKINIDGVSTIIDITKPA